MRENTNPVTRTRSGYIIKNTRQTQPSAYNSKGINSCVVHCKEGGKDTIKIRLKGLKKLAVNDSCYKSCHKSSITEY